jgi:AcrR family transcriptional regulator
VNLKFRLPQEESSLRADARRNRERIVQAALELLAERGERASMEEIARAAGLGVGTLYRHFRDRRALLEHIATNALHQLMAFSEAAAARDIPRWNALRLIVEHCVRLPLALINTMPDGTPKNPERANLARAHKVLLERIVKEARDEGSLRRDIPPREVVDVLQTIVCRPGARADDYLITVMLDGLKA